MNIFVVNLDSIVSNKPLVARHALRTPPHGVDSSAPSLKWSSGPRVSGTHYEKALLGSDGVEHPDFTTDAPATGITVYWEHLVC